MKAKRAPTRQGNGARRPWEQDEGADGLDLPDDEFDYDDFVAREFGKSPHRRVPIRWYWWATAILLLLVMIWGSGRLF